MSWSPTFFGERTDCLKGHKPRFSTQFNPGTDYIKGFHRRCDDFEKVTLKKLIGNVAKQNRNEMEKEKIELELKQLRYDLSRFIRYKNPEICTMIENKIKDLNQQLKDLQPKKVFGIPTKYIPKGHELRLLFPKKFR